MLESTITQHDPQFTSADDARFWVMSTYDFPAEERPYGEDTVAVVDESEGGIILYTHKNNADAIVSALRIVTKNI